MYLDGDLPEEAIQQEMRLAVSAAALMCTLRCAVRAVLWVRIQQEMRLAAREPTPAAHAVLAVAV